MIGLASGHLKSRLWDIMITTIPHRHATLCELLADLDRQITAMPVSVGALLYRDNLSVPYGDKIAAMIEVSRAAYVSCVDDDDLLAPDGVYRIVEALASEPDYVGFKVAWTRDGQPQISVEHSLRHPAWTGTENMLMRSVMQFNPIRREIATAGTWAGGYEAERQWQASVLATGLCKTEAWLDGDPVYLYRESTADTFKTTRFPLPAEAIPELPEYPWLTILDAPGSC